MWLVLFFLVPLSFMAGLYVGENDAYKIGHFDGFLEGMKHRDRISQVLSEFKSKVMSDFDAKYRRSDDE